MEPKLAKLAWQLNLRNAPNHRLSPVMVMSDDKRLPDPAPALQKLPLGSSLVFRHYHAPDRDKQALALRRLCHKLGHLFFVAADMTLALRLKADGLHMPGYTRKTGKTLLECAKKHHLLVSAAIHDMAQLRHMIAMQNRIDAAIISPVFATQSHPGAPHLSAKDFGRMAQLAARNQIGVYAMGGIDFAHLQRLDQKPICGIAGIGFAT
ncbi:thiamine phosphate synthase [Thalassospira sp. TSL5-1]|uniref:thiamine phosphate synthase n=1 Tax=Thalassospira sp. TSL5-1 TaxID=1544451 RepID=UPI00093EE08A|nr:thiamine phosphate synthase [Thalassospira sp. TSL5-1]OKH87381.1 hypothetical protein LF95_11200 [Thalassospira sp. TSL5-1]